MQTNKNVQNGKFMNTVKQLYVLRVCIYEKKLMHAGKSKNTSMSKCAWDENSGTVEV